MPSFVFESDVAGFALIPQHTPLEIISAPPSDVIFPPLDAEVAVILVMDEVVSTGISSFLQDLPVIQ
jgi:hypothetical protein